MTDEKVRREVAAKVRRQLAEPHTPLTDIFPTVIRPPRPSPYERPDLADFVAHGVISPHGGTVQRQYILDCPHGSNELTLPDHGPERDAEVLGNMIRDLWRRTGCSCPPKGWAAA